MVVDADLFENALTQARLVAGVRVESELSAEDLQELVETFKCILDVYKRQATTIAGSSPPVST